MGMPLANAACHRTMPLKKLLYGALVVVALWLIADKLICDRWIYRDYATGVDKRIICPW
jgi:hypothetical protein